MMDLDLLDAEAVGFDPMDLARALPGVLKGTGQALEKKPAAAPAPAQPVARPAPASEIGLGWKIAGGGALALILLTLLRR